MGLASWTKPCISNKYLGSWGVNEKYYFEEFDSDDCVGLLEVKPGQASKLNMKKIYFLGSRFLAKTLRVR